MKDSYKIFLKTALMGGIIFGTILILYTLILWMLNIMPIGLGRILLLFLINLLIYVFGVFWFTRSYRDGYLGGYINFGHAYLFGLTLLVVATLIGAIYSYVFNKFIDPDYYGRIIKESVNWTENFMRGKGLTETQISDATAKITSKPIPTPIKGAIRGIIGGVIGGAIFSLISSAFAKKAIDPFKES